MNIVIFAGGAGTRLWPLSRKNSPKQFEILKDGKSTLQMAIDRVKDFGLEHVFISTNEKYVDLVRQQIPGLDASHIFTEPAKRDLTAAIGLTLLRLKNQGVHGTIAVLWADHFMDNPENFREALKTGKKLVEDETDRIVFLGEKARFANHNLGWIRVGNTKKDLTNEFGEDIYEFLEWKYKPDLESCEEMFGNHNWVWNPGYFIFNIDFMLGLYEKFQGDMLAQLQEMVDEPGKLESEYKKLEAISFDTAILEKIAPRDAVVLKVNLGWSDPGTLYALKEALTDSTEENYTEGKGESIAHKTSDSFIYNEEPHKLVTAVGLEGIIIVNTKDSLLVCHKDSVPNITELLDKLREDGKEHYL